MTTDSYEDEPFVVPTPANKPPISGRKRRTLGLLGLAVAFATSMVIVWMSSTSQSSPYNATTAASSAATRPASALPETTQPATAEQETTDPATTQPATTQPPTTLPPTMQPATKSVQSYSEHAPAVNAPIPPRRKAIVVLGDSTTQYGGGQTGWEVKLHAAYVRSLDTINRGLSGYNTRIFLQYAMPGLIEEATNYYDPLVVVMWFGVNDATLVNGPNKAQHVPLDEYKANLIEMIRQYRSAVPNAKVLLLSPAYIDEVQRHKAVGTRLDRNNEETVKYAKACTEIKKEVFKDDDAVGYIDVYNFFLEKYPADNQRAMVLGDGLHLGRDGDNIFYDLVKAKIEKMVPASELTHSQFPGENAYIQY